MSRRDDMVFRPSLGPQARPTAPVRAREDRRIAESVEGRGGRVSVAARLVALRAARRLARRQHVARSGSRRLAAARTGGAGLRGIRLLGGVVTAFVVAGVVALRIASGQPLEGIGAQVNRMLLGDLDDHARAKLATRRQLQADPDLARIVGQQGEVTPQIAALGRDLYELNLRDEKAKSLFAEAFPANNVVDMLILRGAEALKRAWSGAGGAAAVTKLERGYGRLAAGDGMGVR